MATNGSKAQHEFTGGHVTDLEVGVGAEGDRSIRRTDLLHDVSDLEPIGGKGVGDLGVEVEPVPGLRKDSCAKRDRLVSVGNFSVGREAEESVDGVLSGRLGEGKLQFGSVVRPNSVTNAIGPRHENDAGAHGRCRLGPERLDEVYAVYGI